VERGKNEQRQGQRPNTGILRFAQDDDVKLATTTATARATADPFGDDKQKGNNNGNGI
jgi:hypothetical protein